MSHNRLHLLKIFFLFLLPFWFANSLAALNTENNPHRLVEYLVQEKTNLTLALNEIKLIPAPFDHQSFLKQRQENNLMTTLNHAKIASFESFLSTQKQQQYDLSSRLKHLQQASLSKSLQFDVQERLGNLNGLIDINRKAVDLITENLALANRYQDALQIKRQQLDLWNSKEKRDEDLIGLKKQEEHLTESLERLYNNSIKLQQEAKADNNPSTNFSNEAKILLNNQVINLSQYKLLELDQQKKLVRADYLLLRDPNIKTLQTITECYKTAIAQMAEIEQELKKMASLLTESQLQLTDAALKQQYNAVLRIVNQRVEELAIQQQTLQEDLENHQEELKKQLSVRQSLSSYRLDSWPFILDQLSHIPYQFYIYLKTLGLKLKDNYIWQDLLPITIMWSLLAVLMLVTYGLYRLLKHVTGDKERSRLSGHLYDGLLIILSRNLPFLAITAGLLILFYLNHILFSSYQLLLNLIFVWLVFRILILIARMVLLDRISDASGKDVRLYYRIKWLLLTGGWVTALMVVSHLLPLSILVQDIFNRLFMLFLLAVSIVAWRSREVIDHLLDPTLKTKKRYLRNAVTLLTVLIPLTLFTTAIIGLIGYINLAWSMSRYEVQILLIIISYVLMRGLSIDALDLLSEWMISSLGNGWLWIEVFLKPLEKILRLMLLGFCLFLLCQLLGLYADSPLMGDLWHAAEYPFVNVSGIHITALSVMQFLISLSIFIWIAKWTREFGYRWLYRDARDAGIRNSLSVFTQYAVVLIGCFITLRVLGLDFSGMSMVIGGLAVGMGFGLRDFASNIVGGLMLLIERPVREGDLITLGDYEGRVAHIGIRSMRVSSWDNMEVLIPNAETFNKPFCNWTHQDSIVRTVVPIKVSRVDDPVMVQELITNVLASIPEIEQDPPFQVLLKQIDDALIVFEIRYFINVQLYTRFEIRSKILFAIMAQFKAVGVRAPIPPIHIEFNKKDDNRLPNDNMDG